MLTAIGKYLRKLRIDKGELLREMAGKLGVTASYLSAVENGKRKFPSDWETIITQHYNLNSVEQEKFKNAIEESADSVKIAFGDKSSSHKNIAFAFARKFEELDNDKLEKIKKILEGKN
jgi:transcriptional regulator with XRE-family HTH domain